MAIRHACTVTGTVAGRDGRGAGPVAERHARLALTAGLAIWGAFLASHPSHYGWLDNLDLAIHEAGHPLFGVFGEFIGFLGGTLMQLLMPSLFVWYFTRRGDRHAATVALWWVAQNLWNVSVYVKDARAEELPLVGGGEHDWNYLLGRVGLLAQDRVLGEAIWLAGVLLYLWACLRGWTYALEIGRDGAAGERTASS